MSVLFFFLFVLLAFCLFVLIFIFVEVFLFLKKEQSWMGGKGENMKILYENNFNKNILKMSCWWDISTMKISVPTKVHFLRQLSIIPWPAHSSVCIVKKVLRLKCPRTTSLSSSLSEELEHCYQADLKKIFNSVRGFWYISVEELTCVRLGSITSTVQKEI